MSTEKEKAIRLSETVREMRASGKYKKDELYKNLAGGNEDYESIISLICVSAGYCMYIMVINSILSAILIFLSYSMTVDPDTINTNHFVDTPIVMLLGILSLVLSVVGAVLARRIDKLSVPPNTIRNYYLMILFFDIFPIVVSFMFGIIAIPGCLNFSMIIFIIVALSKMSLFREWFNGYAIKPNRTKKREMPSEEISEYVISTEETDDYDDGL